MAESLQGLQSMLLIDQHDRWQHGDRPKVESYLQIVPELGSDRSRLLDMIYQEIVLREAAKESPTLDEYVNRFPTLKDDLKCQFEVHSAIDWNYLDRPNESSSPTLPTIDGYRIESEMGRGTFGAVYKAWEISLQRFVAIKLLSVEDFAESDDTEDAQAYAEAQSAAKLTHPNIVPVHAVGRCEAGIYFSQELVEGGTLADYARGQRQDCSDAASLVATLADAIHYAHLCRVIHCDLKPANILVRDASGKASGNTKPKLADIQPMVSDFGLARSLDADQLVENHHLSGTLQYMSPEQTGIEELRIGPPTDVYSLGAILYELLTGHPPFTSNSKLEVFLKIRRELPAIPHSIVRSIPADLSFICMKCLAKQPKERYATAAELANDLRRFLRGFAPTSMPVGNLGRFTRWAKRQPVVASLATALLFTGLLSFAIVTRKMFEAQASEKREHERAEELDAALYRNQFHVATLAFEAFDVARTRRLLEQTNPKRRSLEWYHLHSLTDATNNRKRFENHDVHRLAVSPDGKWLVVSDGLESITMIDRLSGKQERMLAGARMDSAPIAFSPDGSQIAAAGHNREDQSMIRIYNAADGELASEIGPLLGSPIAFAFQSGSNQLTSVVWVSFREPPRLEYTGSFSDPLKAVSYADRLLFETWDISTSKRVERGVGPKIEQSFSPTGCLSPDGRRLAWTPSMWPLPPGSAGRHEVQVVDAKNGEAIAILKGHSNHVHGMCFSPDSKIVATFGEDQLCIVWNRETGEELHRLEGHTDSIMTAGFSSDGKLLVTGGRDSAIRIWNVETGSEVRQLRGSHGIVRSVVFSHDGKLIYSCDEENTIGEWNLGKAPTLSFEVKSAATRMACSDPEDYLYVLHLDGGLSLYNSDVTANEPGSLAELKLADRCLDFSISPDGSKIASIATETDQVRIGSLNTISSTNNLASKPNHRILSSSPISWIDIAKGNIACAKGSSPICWSPDGTELAWIAKDQSAVVLCDGSTHRIRSMLSAGKSKFLAIAYGESDMIAAACDDRTVRVWNRTSSNMIREIQVGYQVAHIALRPNGTDIAIAGSERDPGQVIDTKTGEMRCSLNGHKLRITCLSYTPDGLRIVTGSDDRSVKIWDADRGEELLTIGGFQDSIRKLTIRRDSRRLCVSSGLDLSQSTVSLFGESVQSSDASR